MAAWRKEATLAVRADSAIHSKKLNVLGLKNLCFCFFFKLKFSEGLAWTHILWQCPEKGMTGFLFSGLAGFLSAWCVSLSLCFAASGHQLKNDGGKLNKNTTSLLTQKHNNNNKKNFLTWVCFYLRLYVLTGCIIRPLDRERTGEWMSPDSFMSFTSKQTLRRRGHQSGEKKPSTFGCPSVCLPFAVENSWTLLV